MSLPLNQKANYGTRESVWGGRLSRWCSSDAPYVPEKQSKLQLMEPAKHAHAHTQIILFWTKMCPLTIGLQTHTDLHVRISCFCSLCEMRKSVNVSLHKSTFCQSMDSNGFSSPKAVFSFGTSKAFYRQGNSVQPACQFRSKFLSMGHLGSNMHQFDQRNRAQNRRLYATCENSLWRSASKSHLFVRLPLIHTGCVTWCEKWKFSIICFCCWTHCLATVVSICIASWCNMTRVWTGCDSIRNQNFNLVTKSQKEHQLHPELNISKPWLS